MRLTTRRSVRTDWPFIFSTYLKNNWFSPENDTTLRKNTWMKIQHKFLEELLEKTPPPVFIVCLEEDADFIISYVVVKDVPFFYIKQDYRNADVNIRGMLENALKETP